MDGLPADDATLLRKARRGDRAAFQELYQRYRLPVFRYVWRLSGSVQLAEDVLQECFLAMFRGAKFDAAFGPLRTYLIGMARRIALRRMQLEMREVEEQPEAASRHDVLGGLLKMEQAEAVARAVEALPPLQREAIILHVYEELPVAEIAAVTGAGIGAVKVRLHRAREALRKKLGAEREAL